MGNTYSQIYIQVVFTVKGHQCILPKKHREELHKYITGIITTRNQKLLAIYLFLAVLKVYYYLTRTENQKDFRYYPSCGLNNEYRYGFLN